MANLRANKITTGTADYQGSIYASGTNAYLITTTTAPGTDDFTIECWINSDNASGTYQDGIFAINAQTVASGGFQSSASNQLRLAQGRDGTDGQNGGLEVKLDGTVVGTPDGEDIIQEGTWHHVAVTRASGTVKIWVDGVEKASGSAAGDITGTTFATAYYDGNYTYQGYMSNFRYRKGTAHYTTTFTPPTGPLERTSDTELLFAQSVNNAGDGYSSAIHGGTTDIMQVKGNVTANTSAPTLTTSSSVGAVFEGDTKVNTQGYMYFPTGDTSQRGRGRAVFFSGNSTVTPAADSLSNTIDYIQIQSGGTAIDFGDMPYRYRRNAASAFSSSTRGINAGGFRPSSPSRIDTIMYINIATTSNALDFGNLSEVASDLTGLSNETRGMWAGALLDGSWSNQIQYITIASTGNTTDFGDLNEAYSTAAGCASPTRGLIGGGYNNTPATTTNKDFINYITIATTGNTTDFGNLTVARRGPGASSSQTRALWAFGASSPTEVNTIDYITIATTGDATDFGDYTILNSGGGGSSNGTRGVFGGGYGASPHPKVNVINRVEIATTGNAQDFGDLSIRRANSACTSDSHGGLS